MIFYALGANTPSKLPKVDIQQRLPPNSAFKLSLVLIAKMQAMA
jgi:hypothetical protein